MALNQSLKGKEYGTIEVKVDRDRVAAFADAIRDPNPVYRDEEAAKAAGYPGIIAPPTFPTTIQIMASGQVVLDQELGLNYMMVVHGEQAFEWHRPIVVGDTLTATPRIADIFVKGRNEFLVIDAEIRDPDGEIVCLSRGTLISRGTAEGGE